MRETWSTTSGAGAQGGKSCGRRREPWGTLNVRQVQFLSFGIKSHCRTLRECRDGNCALHRCFQQLVYRRRLDGEEVGQLGGGGNDPGVRLELQPAQHLWEEHVPTEELASQRPIN